MSNVLLETFTIMKIVHKAVLALVIFAGVLILTSGESRARKIMRKTDCGKDTVCLDAFQKKKEIWLQCLENEGIPEKKRKKLSARVEVLGIRNLKKQEILIFDSGRKRCHKNFLNALSEISQGNQKKPLFPIDNPFPDVR